MLTRFARLVVVSIAALVLLSSAQPSGAQTAAPSGAAAPLIDRELLFGDPELAAARLSPNGDFIAFIKPYKGMRNVWVKRRSQRSRESR